MVALALPVLLEDDELELLEDDELELLLEELELLDDEFEPLDEELEPRPLLDELLLDDELELEELELLVEPPDELPPGLPPPHATRMALVSNGRINLKVCFSLIASPLLINYIDVSLSR